MYYSNTSMVSTTPALGLCSSDAWEDACLRTVSAPDGVLILALSWLLTAAALALINSNTRVPPACLQQQLGAKRVPTEPDTHMRINLPSGGVTDSQDSSVFAKLWLLATRLDCYRVPQTPCSSSSSKQCLTRRKHSR